MRGSGWVFRWSFISTRACWVCALLPALLLLIAGCPAPSPGGNANDNTPDNGNENQNDNVVDAVNEISLRRIADGLTSPVDLAVPDDGSDRLFVVDQIGLIHIIDADGNLLPEPFLDISGQVIQLNPEFDERGLLGLAFHPDYQTNGRFFVFYSAPPIPENPETNFVANARSRISEFQVSDDPDVADPDSQRILLEIDKPQSNHNGGQIGFGPEDGFLYISVGDGGGAHDVGDGHNPEIGNGQDRTTLLGKLLRIDVNSGDPYAIPQDNPFVDDAETRPEIWALGLRNPWRFSFDRGNPSRLFIADVGQNLFEEVNLGEAGANYGWNIREGTQCFNPDSPDNPPAECPDTGAQGEPLVDSIIEYSHINEEGERVLSSITGGFVYRGTDIPGLAGDYVFGDWSAQAFDAADGVLLAAAENADGTWTVRELDVANDPDGRIGRFVLAFGQDSDDELYVLTTANVGPAGTTGEVYRIQAAP